MEQPNPQTPHTGLTQRQAEQSRALHGQNIIPPPPRTPLWRQLLLKFTDPLIIILLVAGALSIGISAYEHWGLGQAPTVFFEPVGIFAAVMLATGLSFIFEFKAEKEFAILNRVNDLQPVQVIRAAGPAMIPRKDIVVGDTVTLATGDEVPADGILLDAVTLTVDESTLTGEPLCHKTTNPAHFHPQATYPSNHALRGTKIMEGHGVMRVIAVGPATQAGKVFIAAQENPHIATPLSRQLNRLGTLITRFAYTVAALVVIGRLAMFLIHTPSPDWFELSAFTLNTVMLAVALIAVAVPEGLPMAVTLSLAYSMRRMLKTQNLVRRMHACETMGATTVICTDKTGTLTQNRMQVAHTAFFGNPSPQTIACAMALNSTATLDLSTSPPTPLGNPTEGALLLWLHAQGTDPAAIRAAHTRLAELPFSPERKYMATIVAANNAPEQKILLVKGAPEIVFALCRHTPGVTPRQLNALLLSYQNQAMRTLAFAHCVLAPGQDPITGNTLHAPGLTFLGVAAISDPVRPDVPTAVQEVTRAGIQIKIVTGDTPATATQIARQIGLWHDNTHTGRNIITGPEFARLTPAQRKERVAELKIIARARPLDKQLLVRALQDTGQVVAVTGDGTNDAPALRAAHVGLSMGAGTAVAKEASDITIIDNSFASIGRAVMWGRSLYQNIQRFILFQLTVNLAACLTVLTGAFMGMQSPLTVTQMLWVNLIMDTFAAMALASLPPSPAVMKLPPRPQNAFIITPPMWRTIIGTALTFFTALLALLIHLHHTTTFGPRQLTVFFTTFVFLQFWNLFNARAFATHRSALRLKGCRGFIAIAAIILAGQILIVQFGGPFFNVTPLPPATWLTIIAATSPTLLIPELLRTLRHHPAPKTHTDRTAPIA